MSFLEYLIQAKTPPNPWGDFETNTQSFLSLFCSLKYTFSK